MDSRGDVPGGIASDPAMVHVILMHGKKLRHIWPRGLRRLLQEGLVMLFLANGRNSWGDEVHYADGTAEVGIGNTILSACMT